LVKLNMVAACPEAAQSAAMANANAYFPKYRIVDVPKKYPPSAMDEAHKSNRFVPTCGQLATLGANQPGVNCSPLGVVAPTRADLQRPRQAASCARR
jgi:hypothetical protein